MYFYAFRKPLNLPLYENELEETDFDINVVDHNSMGRKYNLKKLFSQKVTIEKTSWGRIYLAKKLLSLKLLGKKLLRHKG